jgi:hypothetical protein
MKFVAPKWPGLNRSRRKIQMPDDRNHEALAPLSICEALLLALNDHRVLPEGKILSILNDAAATHENAVGSDRERQVYQAVAKLIKRIIAGGNSVR